MIVVWFRT